MIKGVIYDLDDLMVNSHPLHYKTDKLLLKKYGYNLDSVPKELLSKFVGMRTVDVWNIIIRELNLKEGIDYLHKKRTQLFLKLVEKELKIMPGLLHSLKLLKENKFKLAIASSGIREYIQIVLKKFNLTQYFDSVISGDDVKVGKPDPEIYITTCRELNLNPGECLVLEDATNGIESAKKAGCKCIAIRNLNTPPQNYSKADLVLNSLEELSLDVIHTLNQ